MRIVVGQSGRNSIEGDCVPGWDYVVGNGRGMIDGRVVGSHDSESQSIRVVLVGDFERGRPSGGQVRSLTRLLRRLLDESGCEIENIVAQGLGAKLDWRRFFRFLETHRESSVIDMMGEVQVALDGLQMLVGSVQSEIHA